VVYLAVFVKFGIIKVGKATPWTVGSRVAAASDKLPIPRADDMSERPIIRNPEAWRVRLFGEKNVPWSVSERVEHAAAGRLAHNVGATPVDHTQGKEWLKHDDVGTIDWPNEFHRAVRETLPRPRRGERRPPAACAVVAHRWVRTSVAQALGPGIRLQDRSEADTTGRRRASS